MGFNEGLSKSIRDFSPEQKAVCAGCGFVLSSKQFCRLAQSIIKNTQEFGPNYAALQATTLISQNGDPPYNCPQHRQFADVDVDFPFNARYTTSYCPTCR